MIIGNINHLELVPYLPAKIKQAIKYVQDNVNKNTPVGRYNIDGDNVYLILSDCQPRDLDDTYPEYHKKYVDVQIVLGGQEAMGISTLPPHTKMVEDDIVENDIAFIETPEEETVLVLRKNDFIVLYPNEVHKPLCAVDDSFDKVQKAVIKIAVDIL
ncbi:YhcH/YjgK/YiaL family protein [Orbaceae bacterium ESL0727]|nr:YhcH/YjgK/YiaL family protein [Orbaceae bacterium ESL0727]